ncbi:unnamed protein product [Caenorhabditis angaria]|uniref:Uncharacterized protein n=1 Tax=Caenorhabditis angaria TaxID=860376 RepID=A0A9P1IS31_9PELO|nr:unnamed protein product [Caenorhabditis angaria]
MDLFDAFDTSQTSTIAASGDAMQNLDDEKKNKAKQQAANLLDAMRMDTGIATFQEEDDSETPAKRQKMDVDEVEDEVVQKFEHIVVHTIKTDNENCTHKVALPPGIEFAPLRQSAREPAKYYPFQLDAFQKQAILCIENNQSVLVSAHTSAGKTVVATYAIAQCLRDKQRVIYTSPIKALSNQKYRELEEEFGDVGLMTGDVTLNPDASCLVMTTEILRSMLYRGSEIMKEVGWVIFDEIHYMRDKERGVVWEETIILMSEKVRHAFLSATIPNAKQFAQWICAIKHQPCNVVYTDYRPTPLQHFIYPVGGEGLYEVVNVKGEFREDKFKDAMSGLATTGDKAGGFQKRNTKGTKGDSNVLRIIRTIRESDMMPCIVFSFSRKECEAYALSLKDMDFNEDTEKKMVSDVYNSAIDSLSEDDRQLPQIGSLLPLLRRGIGVHHSGLLPILKETIEILFGEGLLKVLFATETFSMGLNMPARTVVFTSARKFDGTDNRFITSGEYIQMSGRAGRRGKDDRGLVILMVDHQLTADDAKQIIKGATDPLNSQFRLTYNMVLNLLRVEGLAPDHIIKSSFFQFQNYDKIPGLRKKIQEVERKVDRMKLPYETEINTYMDIEKEIEQTKNAIKSIVRLPKHIVPFLHAGRLVKVVSGERDFGWGVIVNYKRRVNPDDKTDMLYVVEVMLAIDPSSVSDTSNPSTLIPAFNKADRRWEVVPMTCDRIDEISAIRVKLPQDLSTHDGRMRLNGIMTQVMVRMNGIIPQLDPITDMKITDENFKKTIENLKLLEGRLEEHPMRKRNDFEDCRKEYERKKEAEKELKAANDDLKKAESVLQLGELGHRKRVLRRLGYCSKDNTIELKGRVACELSASDELILTEMLLKGTFNALDDAQIGALLSCFVFQDNCPAPKLAQELSGCLRTLQEQARHVAKVSNECKVEVIEDKYVNSFNPGLMDVVYQWINGASFSEIVKTTDVFEGSIIRCLRRLEEVLREMVNAAKACDNKDLEEKFESARKKLKRDIVFAASLYL